jgi:uncharacterized coiled-coil protein SlyX
LTCTEVGICPYRESPYLLGISGQQADTRGVFTVDAQTLTIIATLAVLMIGVTRTNTRHLTKRIHDLEKHTDQRIDALKAELSSRLDRVEARLSKLEARFAKLEARLGTVEFEVGELKTAVVKMDGRLYDLATGRHIPLIIPSR